MAAVGPPPQAVPAAMPVADVASAIAASHSMGLTAQIPQGGPTVVAPPGQAAAVSTASLAGTEFGAMTPGLPGPAAPELPKVLVLGDENLLFTCGLQDAYQNLEFTAASALSRQNLEVYNFDPNPLSLRGRMRYMVDPCRVGKHFKQHEFDALILFLPGLSFLVPQELGTADRPLFAYRTHLFVFHVIRHAKLVLKNEAKLHLVWPEETGLMTSPCGAAGIEMPNLMTFCGGKPLPQELEYSKVEEGWFMPFIFGEVPQGTPEWLQNMQISTYSIDKSSIPVPLSVALLLHPDVAFVSIKDPSTSPNPPPAPGAALRACLVHEANARRHRLKEIFGPRERAETTADAYGLVPEPPDADSLLSIPMEIFMTSFDDIPHISQMLKFQVIEDQPTVSVATLDMLDPRLPTRIARPPPANKQGGGGGKKRVREEEEWGGMKFHCTLTRIMTGSADRMRLHMQGDLYRKMAACTPSWETSQDKADLVAMLNESEQLDQRDQRAKKAINAANAAISGGMNNRNNQGGKGGKGGRR